MANKVDYPEAPKYNLARGITFVTCCWDCAAELGWDSEKAEGVCTAYEAVCEGCGEIKMCTQPRDFGLTEEQVLAAHYLRSLRGETQKGAEE